MEVGAKTHVRGPKAHPSRARVTARAGLTEAGVGAAPATLENSGVSFPLPSHSEWLLAKADAHRRKLFVAVLAVYLVAFNGQWRLDSDSALYLTIGRNLAEGRGFTYHGQLHTLAYPGMPWLFAGLFKVFGTDSLLPADVALLACGLATLALTYRLFLLHAGRPTAVVMTVALALSRMFFRYSFELMSDMPFLLGVTAFLAGCEAVFYRRDDRRRRWYDFALLPAGLAIAVATRPTMWALLVAVGVTLVVSLFARPCRRTWRLGGAACAMAAAVGAALLFHRLGGDYERVVLDTLTQPGKVAQLVLHQNLPDVLSPGAAEAVFGVDWGRLRVGNAWLPVGALPSLLSIAAGIWLVRRRMLWGLWVAVSVVMMLFTLVEVRYFLQVLPLLLYGWWLMFAWLDRRLSLGNRWLGLLPMTAFVFVVGINSLRVASVVAEQRGIPFLESYRRGKYALVPDLTKLVQDRVPQGAWVLVPERQLGRILSYTTGRYTVEPGPLTQLDPQTQTVFVLEPLEPAEMEWMRILRIGVGEPVGPPVVGRRGKGWQLHHAVRLPPETSPGSATTGAAGAPPS